MLLLRHAAVEVPAIFLAGARARFLSRLWRRVSVLSFLRPCCEQSPGVPPSPSRPVGETLFFRGCGDASSFFRFRPASGWVSPSPQFLLPFGAPWAFVCACPSLLKSKPLAMLVAGGRELTKFGLPQTLLENWPQASTPVRA